MSYNWNTSFDNNGKIMTHVFSDRIKVVNNMETGEIKVCKDGSAIRNLDNDMSIPKYLELLVSVAKDSEKLESFNK